MENYIGKICPYCKTEIKEGEEIKVCPVCGIPHHAGCWEENKGCTTFGCSGQHYEVQGTNPTEVCNKCGNPLGDGQAFCPKCGTPKISRQTHCGKCGAPLTNGQEFCAMCGQKVGVVLDSNVSNAINQFNANVKPENSKKGNIFSILAIIFGAISIIFSGIMFKLLILVPAIVFAIIGLYISKNRKKVTTIVSIVVIIIALIISPVVNFISNTRANSKNTFIEEEDFSDMYSHMEHEDWCEIGSDGTWISIDTNPYDWDDEFEVDALTAIETIKRHEGKSLEFQELMKKC